MLLNVQITMDSDSKPSEVSAPAVNEALESLKEAIVPLPDRYNEQSCNGSIRKVIALEEIIGYWRKEPNLHGFIVENFADGNDDCREEAVRFLKENRKEIGDYEIEVHDYDPLQQN